MPVWCFYSHSSFKPLAIKLAAVMVLHTWGQRMNPHVHAHVIVPIGGLSLDGKRWVQPSDPDAFFETAGLARRFREAFLDGLEEMYRNGYRKGRRRLKLRFTGRLAHLAEKEKFDAWLAPLRTKDWVVHCQGPSDESKAPDAALKYLANFPAAARRALAKNLATSHPP